MKPHIWDHENRGGVKKYERRTGLTLDGIFSQPRINNVDGFTIKPTNV